MMDDMAEAKRIAARLTKAQQEAVIRAAPPPLAAKPFYIPIIRDGGEIARALRAQGLARLFNRGTALLPFGLAVRAALLADPSSTGGAENNHVKRL